jgi:uncharacterized SAM-binding protein YcdF (DUF218 family)
VNGPIGVTARDRDKTPVAIVRPLGRDEIAGVDDLGGFSAGFSGDPSTAASGRRRRWQIVRRSLLAMFLLVAGYYSFTLVQVYRIGRSEEARAADAIVVLGAAQYDGTPSPQLAARLDHVVTLYAEGIAPLVVVTGGKQPNDRFTEAEASARYLAERGVPSEAITMEGAGRSTYESLANTADLLGQRGLDRVVVVTDPYHALRSRLIAQDVGLTAHVSPTPTSVVGGANSVRRHLVEAAGVALGRIVGFEHL